MLIYVGLMVATILAILVVNNWWLERYYVNQKLKVMEEAYNTDNHKEMEEAESDFRSSRRSWIFITRVVALQTLRAVWSSGLRFRRRNKSQVFANVDLDNLQ